MNTSNRITVERVGAKWVVFANDGVCWCENSFAVAAFRASGMARELNWPVFLVPERKSK